MKIQDIIQTYFSCYEKSDKETLENILDNRFEISSPHDNKLDKSSYLEKCWGFNKSVEQYQILKFIENTNEAFLSYKAILYDKREIENAEYFKILGGRIINVKVYYGNI
ncbi:hypothetical protein Q4566_15860 [Tamlana sp. 2_MG-2023]|uniref:hypothetical protein n=1 Tax=unclassified Tamlana TaxID=2614803 RepID=UPI0026E229F6|nr:MULTISPECIES: hypothetical protein [unclassified Tamlana]MDO6761683.1 hypothetical protein [Tamlana sp. 2_MG-2023]MDO6792237.1 hypothetical protein [Tamlana sp. 1_MG-2023]